MSAYYMVTEPNSGRLEARAAPARQNGVHCVQREIEAYAWGQLGKRARADPYFLYQDDGRGQEDYALHPGLSW